MFKKSEEEVVELWDLFRLKGDEKAYSLIYECYSQHLFNYGRRFTLDKDLVKDAIHDVFVRLWKNKHNIGATKSVKYYLFKSLRREIFKKLAQIKKLGILDEHKLNDFTIEISHEAQLIARQHSVAVSKQLSDAIHALPARQKEAVFLRFYENMDFEEISSLMKVETRSIYKLIYKALKKLSEKIGGEALILFLMTIS